MALRQLPDWAILGAPKAGTTSLASWLDSHPQGHVPPAKEVAYFNRFFHRGPDWYASQFAAAGAQQRCGDATPAYLYSDEALDRLASAAPDVRLIVILREPADRAWSHFWYNRALGLEPRSFDRAIRAERRDPANAPYGLELGYLACSRYADRLAAVTARFGRAALLVVFFDDLRDDPTGVFCQVCAHLGLAPAVLPLDGRARNIGRQPRSATAQHLLLRCRAGSWPAQLGPRLTRVNARPGGYPAMTPDVRADLRREFRRENERLSTWLDHPLPPGWTDAGPVPAQGSVVTAG